MSKSTAATRSKSTAAEERCTTCHRYTITSSQPEYQAIEEKTVDLEREVKSKDQRIVTLEMEIKRKDEILRNIGHMMDEFGSRDPEKKESDELRKAHEYADELIEIDEMEEGLEKKRREEEFMATH
jgi:wobble nucleotide-excising tRNase